MRFSCNYGIPRHSIISYGDGIAVPPAAALFRAQTFELSWYS
jgi:hypothetical protein